MAFSIESSTFLVFRDPARAVECKSQNETKPRRVCTPMEAKKSIGVLKIIFKTFFRRILVLKKILDKTQIRRGYFGRLEKI